MPEICRFYGIIIAIYYSDHAPPHFHARYGKQKASFRIIDSGLLEGSLPPRALGLVIEWAEIHRQELETNWKRAKTHQTLEPIEPLQ